MGSRLIEIQKPGKQVLLKEQSIDLRKYSMEKKLHKRTGVRRFPGVKEADNS